MAKKTSFEDQMAKLESIRDELENNELSLDDAIKKYEEGVKVLKVCRDQLDGYEAKIEELSAIDDEAECEDEE